MPPYLAGRDMEAILHAFPEPAPAAAGRQALLQPLGHRAEPGGPARVVRRDFDAGMSERAFEGERVAGTEKDPRKPTAMNGLHTIIDAMIEADSGIGTATIRQHLADDHGATVAYPLRHYVVRRRGRHAVPAGGPD
jgi:hypothetical protein